MSIRVGERLPNVTLTAATPDGPRPTTVEEVFAGKRAVLFAVPGAFTPTCSARHLPGFLDKAAEIKAKGIDLIACVAVNDAFVMRAWAESQDVAEDILMLADGGADFTKAVGLEMDASKFGLGLRSQRYAMVLDDAVVKALNVEEGGEFRVSSAEHVLSQL
jgi:peroxiredoxin